MSEHEKRILKLTTRLIKKKLGDKSKPENIHKFLMSSKCEALLETVKLINFIADNTNSRWQSNYVRNYGEFALWVAINHPMYRKALELSFNKFTKYNNVKIDLKSQFTTLDIIMFNQIIKYGMKKILTRPTYLKIIEESLTSPNNIARYFMSHVDEALLPIKVEFGFSSAKSILWLLLWIGICDTAYRSQLYYGLKKLGNNDIAKMAEEFYDEPKDWFINVYIDSTETTKKLRADKKLPRHMAGYVEKQCIPDEQQRKMNRILKKIGGAFWDA